MMYHVLDKSTTNLEIILHLSVCISATFLLPLFLLLAIQHGQLQKN